jgi:two-component system sensor kinase FixL
LSALREQVSRLTRLTATERIALNLTHEVNQPLAAIVNYVRAAQLLLAGDSPPDIGRLRVALDGAMAQSLHASRIAGGLRDFVTRGDSIKRAEKVEDLVRAAVALALPETEPHGVLVSLALDPAAAVVLADRVQIEQVLVNLISNAVQAMQDSRRRALSIATQRVGETVAISVADSGKGIPDSVRAHLFEPFVTTRQGGTGLGLMVCRAFVEAHGGSLSCQSMPGRGSVFRFTLPGGGEAAA